jgi:hypothetical protein
MLLNLPFVGASICPMMPAMEKMSCCSVSTISGGDFDSLQLQKAHCGCAISKSTNTDVNVISSPDFSRLISKQLAATLVSVSSAAFESEFAAFRSAIYHLHQQLKFLDSQHIYDFISSYLI